MEHLYLELWFTEKMGSPRDNLQDTLRLLVNGYNLLEPEYSNEFPMVKIDILCPQLFKTRSVLLSDGDIRNVYFNADTEMGLVDQLLMERNATQALPKLEVVQPIGGMIPRAVSLAQEYEAEELNLFEEPSEKPIDSLDKFSHTCMGGTFDHMHLGHKLLLT